MHTLVVFHDSGCCLSNMASRFQQKSLPFLILVLESRHCVADRFKIDNIFVWKEQREDKNLVYLKLQVDVQEDIKKRIVFSVWLMGRTVQCLATVLIRCFICIFFKTECFIVYIFQNEAFFLRKKLICQRGAASIFIRILSFESYWLLDKYFFIKVVICLICK